MIFTPQQKKIIEILHEETALSLSQISRKTGIGKSTLLYQLSKLSDSGILEKQTKSTKLIKYRLAKEENLDEYIRKVKFSIEEILKPGSLKGLNQYIKLLDEVSSSSGNVFAYLNLKRSLLTRFKKYILQLTQKLHDSNRLETLIFPDTKHNNFLHSELIKIMPDAHVRFLQRKIFDDDIDVYLWDGKVAVCSFDGERINIFRSEDSITFEIYCNWLESLWSSGQEKGITEKADQRLEVLSNIINESESNKFLNLIKPYPVGLNPEWIQELQSDHSSENLSDSISKIKKYFSGLLKADSITLTSTIKESLLISLSSVIQDSRSEIIFFEPGDISNYVMAKTLGANPVLINTGFYGFDIKLLRQKFSENTRAVFVSNPNSPLGEVFSDDNMRKIINFCEEKKVVLIIDYSAKELLPFNVKLGSVKELAGEKLSWISIGDTSRILNLDMASIGAISSSERLKDKLRKFSQIFGSQISTQSIKTISSIVDSHKFDLYMSDLNGTIRENYEYLKENLRSEVEVINFEGGNFCGLNFQKFGIPEKDLCEIFKKESSLLAFPLSSFYISSFKKDLDSVLCISIAVEPDLIKQLCRIINDFVEARETSRTGF
jgi:aspartate/methionine/tyrosine aminotransferase/DNA-binding MarR family transcriptional regulator